MNNLPTSYHIPRSVVKSSRRERDIPKLQIHKQENSQAQPVIVDTIPADLHGYAFIVGALFQSENRPQEDGTLLYTGDGMVYRIGFEKGRASLKTRIAKTPCYYADLPTQLYLAKNATEPKSKFAKKHKLFSYFAGFRDGGQARYSIIFGGRNQLNTAFFKTRDSLIVTIDAGRPYVLDPSSLELIEPIGSTKQWKGILPVITNVLKNSVFDTYVNSAHPVADLSKLGKQRDELFTTNYSTGYNGKFKKPVNSFLNGFSALLKLFSKEVDNEIFGFFTYLVRYRFGDRQAGLAPDMKLWRMVLPDGKPVLVEQSLHQLGMTEKYMILSDITFRMEFSQLFSPFFLGFLRLPIFQSKKFYPLAALLYNTFLKPIKPLPYGTLYIVNRHELDSNSASITAKKVTIPIEISHYAVDYDNPDDKITVHIGHSNGADVTEGITRYDKAVPGKKPELRINDLEGMMSGTTDLSYLGRYIIDGKTGSIEDVKLVKDIDSTWALSVYTHRDLCRDSDRESSQKVKNIYWMSMGFTWETIPQRIYDAYKADKRRNIPIDELDNDYYKPVTLLRLDTEKMEIVDKFNFPDRHFASSPQFIPSSQPANDKDPSVDGYIICIVCKDNPDNLDKSQDEFWIFHADDFNNKPIYRLSAPVGEEPLNMAFSLHSTWLPDLNRSQYTEEERRQKRKDSIELDYDDLLKTKSKLIQELFRDIVYPNFIDQTLEKKLEEILEKDS